ncbi:MAG TPA: HAMP domain-containing sensor histidine kinase [Gemmatimonadales bacterium]
MRSASLGPLRLRLTLWYLSTLCAILLLLGLGLFLTIRHQITDQREVSLRAAVAQVERAARTRERESGLQGPVADAVLELRIPGRTLYLFDTTGLPVVPQNAPEWVRTAALSAGAHGTADVIHHIRHQGMMDLYAERFALGSGRPMVAAAIGDMVELEERYASLIAAFGGSAVVALLLVLCGGWLLVRKSTEPIERTMEQMRQFMADAAHELRTPIAVLRTRADVALQRDREPGAYVDALRGIESESRRLSRIVDDLLILARADSGERPIVRARVFLDDIVADAAGAADAMAAARGVTLDLAEFDEAPVSGDAELLRQLVMIFLDNAIKFTPPGGHVEVRVGVQHERAVMTVTDDGPGIPPAQLPHIFERFYRGDPARPRDSSAAAGGAGLGLAIAKWIADAHGGTVDVTSTEGRGTSISVQLPVMARAPSVSSC